MKKLEWWLAVGCALAACSPRPAPTTASTTAVSGASVTSCRLTFTDTEGCAREDVEQLIAPARPRIEACRGSSGGKISIRIREVDGGLTFRVQPGSSLNPTERECILDALNTVSLGGTNTTWTGLSVPPTGFTSLLTIEF